MNKEGKSLLLDELEDKFSNVKYFYLTDCSTLSVAATNKLRRACFERNIELRVVKNTLIRKSLERVSPNRYNELFDTLKGPTAVMFSEDGKEPARLIKELRTKQDKPILKAAYVEESVFVGDDQIEALLKIKSKQELLGELLGLLQSPMMNLVSALNYGGATIAGILKTLEEREATGAATDAE